MSSTWDNSWITGLHAKINGNVQTAAGHLVEAMRVSIDINCPAYHDAAGLHNPPGRHPGYAIARQKLHSPPGGPPYLETGNLHGSVTYEMVTNDPNEIVALVGSDVGYGLDLEQGTSRVAARPWCAAALADNIDQVTSDIIG